MCDAQNEHIFGIDLVDNHVFSYGEGAAVWAKILISGAPHIGKAGKEKEAVGYGVNQAIGDLDVTAFFCDVKPDVVKIAFSRWRNTMRH